MHEPLADGARQIGGMGGMVGEGMAGEGMGGEEMSQESLKLRRSNERRLQMAHARGVARHIALLGASRSRKGSRYVPAPNRAAGASPRKCTAPTVTPKPMPSATSAPAGRNDPIPSVAAPTAGRSATADRSAATRRRQDSTSVVSLLVSLAVSLNVRGGGGACSQWGACSHVACVGYSSPRVW